MKRNKNRQFEILYAYRKHRHELDRKNRRRLARKRGAKKSRFHPNPPNFSHPLMELLRKNFKGQSIATVDSENNRWVIQIPSVFSFIRNPNETINVIYSIVEISRQTFLNSIFFDHSKLKDMDIGASAVLDVVALSLRNEWKRRGLAYSIGGALPNDTRLRNILMTMGIPKQFNVSGLPKDPLAEKFIVPFPLYSGHKQNGSEIGGPQHRDKAVSALVSYFNTCLFTASNYTLTTEGERNLTKWAGEIITNAEEHSGNSRWFAIGYMSPVIRNPNSEGANQMHIFGECQIAIFGFGKSMYDSLSSECTPSETRKQIQELVDKQKSVLGLWNRYSEKDLWTLYALQDGVSRFSPSPGENTRGKGTVEMIESFHHFKSTEDDCKTQMILISGSTCIHFNDKYHLQEEERLGGFRKIIAFNSENKLEERPDPEHVYSLHGHFPGTVLSFSVFIDNTYLDKKFEQIKQNGI